VAAAELVAVVVLADIVPESLLYLQEHIILQLAPAEYQKQQVQILMKTEMA